MIASTIAFAAGVAAGLIAIWAWGEHKKQRTAKEFARHFRRVEPRPWMEEPASVLARRIDEEVTLEVHMRAFGCDLRGQEFRWTRGGSA